jgi:hypothetical protein
MTSPGAARPDMRRNQGRYSGTAPEAQRASRLNEHRGLTSTTAQRAPRLNEHHGSAGTAAQRAPRPNEHRGPTSTAAQRAPRGSAGVEAENVGGQLGEVQRLGSWPGHPGLAQLGAAAEPVGQHGGARGGTPDGR